MSSQLKKLNYVDNKQKRDLFFSGRNVSKKILDDLIVTQEYMYYVSKEKVVLEMLEILLKLMGNKKINYLKNLVITDSTGGIGGDAHIFCQYFKKVNVFEIGDIFPVLKHNLKVLGCNKNTNLFNKNYLENLNKIKQDVVFMDPPWLNFKDQYGKRKPYFKLNFGNQRITDVVNQIEASFICLKLPINYDITNLFMYIKRKNMHISKLDKKRVAYVIFYD